MRKVITFKFIGMGITHKVNFTYVNDNAIHITGTIHGLAVRKNTPVNGFHWRISVHGQTSKSERLYVKTNEKEGSIRTEEHIRNWIIKNFSKV